MIHHQYKSAPMPTSGDSGVGDQTMPKVSKLWKIYCARVLAECKPFCNALVYWFMAWTISSSVCSRSWAVTARVFFMPAISSKMNPRNFSVRDALMSSDRASLLMSDFSCSACFSRVFSLASNCLASPLSISASCLSNCVSLSIRVFRSASHCLRNSQISFTSAAVSTCNFDGNSPRNCAMPFSRAEHRSVNDSIEAASFSMRTTMFACSFSSMSFAMCSVRPWTCLLASTRRLISEFIAFSSLMSPSWAVDCFCISVCLRLTVSPSITLSKPMKRWPTSTSLLRSLSRSTAFSPGRPRAESNVRCRKLLDCAPPLAMGALAEAAGPAEPLRDRGVGRFKEGIATTAIVTKGEGGG
mmetsp:Transcript_46473/g.89694  ORF Transcript_46473/g.89694 Transcript_46473/m.89694 type:complete len:356 (+) Transcript_46473:172-1239(+)